MGEEPRRNSSHVGLLDLGEGVQEAGIRGKGTQSVLELGGDRWGGSRWGSTRRKTSTITDHTIFVSKLNDVEATVPSHAAISRSESLSTFGGDEERRNKVNRGTSGIKGTFEMGFPSSFSARFTEGRVLAGESRGETLALVLELTGMVVEAGDVVAEGGSISI